MSLSKASSRFAARVGSTRAARVSSASKVSSSATSSILTSQNRNLSSVRDPGSAHGFFSIHRSSFSRFLGVFSRRIASFLDQTLFLVRSYPEITLRPDSTPERLNLSSWLTSAKESQRSKCYNGSSRKVMSSANSTPSAKFKVTRQQSKSNHRSLER
jgi:hypothetical protein